MATAVRTSSRCSCPIRRLPTSPDLHARLQRAVDRVNADLSVIEKVRRFILADEAFTIENEQLTPSMKIRRHVISQSLRRAPRRALQALAAPRRYVGHEVAEHAAADREAG